MRANGGRWSARGLGLFSVIAFWPIVSSFLFWQIAPVCKANLTILGHTLSDYQRDEGTFPASLTALIDVGLATNVGLHCPLSGIDRMNGRSDYVYVAGLSPSDPRSWILAFDRPGNHEPGDGYVLYIGGEVKHFQRGEFGSEIERFQREYEAARGQLPTFVD